MTTESEINVDNEGTCLESGQRVADEVLRIMSPTSFQLPCFDRSFAPSTAALPGTQASVNNETVPGNVA